MDRRCGELVLHIRDLFSQLEEAQRELDAIQSICTHQWNEKYTPDYDKAYTIPGDPPGTMGVDWRGSVHVPEKTTKKWTRTCDKCGKEETTTSTKKKVETSESPRW